MNTPLQRIAHLRDLRVVKAQAEEAAGKHAPPAADAQAEKTCEAESAPATVAGDTPCVCPPARAEDGLPPMAGLLGVKNPA